MLPLEFFQVVVQYVPFSFLQGNFCINDLYKGGFSTSHSTNKINKFIGFNGQIDVGKNKVFILVDIGISELYDWVHNNINSVGGYYLLQIVISTNVEKINGKF